MRVLDGGPLQRPLVPLPQQLLGQKGDGGYEDRAAEPGFMPWTAVQDRVLRLTNLLRQAGIQPGDRVAILGETSRAWMLLGHAVHCAQAVVVPIYPSLPKDQVEYILRDAGVRLVAADANQRPKLADAGVVQWILGQEGDAPPAACGPVALDDPALLIYTSGTTGVPKGVLLSHRNVAGDVAGAIEGLQLDRIQAPSLVAFLPVAHVAGYVSLAALMSLGGRVLFSRPDRMTADLAAFRPTIVLAVPRLWERILRKVDEAGAQQGGAKARLFAKARSTALAAGQALQAGPLTGALRLRHALFERLLYRKLRARLGMDRTVLAITGAAAVRPDLLWLLRGFGLPIIEGYGMTESSALSVCTRRDAWKAGTVGTPLPGCQVAVDDDGEILIGGIGVFQQYWGLPSETAATRVLIDGRPWVRSGDIGVLEGGVLRIVDRKKELEVLDTGKKIAPARVEDLLKSASPYVEDALLVGTGQKFAGVLIQPAYDALLHWAREQGIAADGIVRQKDPTGEQRTYAVGEGLLRHPQVRALFAGAVQAVNGRVADYERIGSFDLLPTAFTLERGELTPSFKKKRKAILANHQARVAALFA